MTNCFFFFRSLTIFAAGFIVIMSLNCFTGVVMFARYFDCDPIQAKVNNLKFPMI